ncbi:tetratricopeptide repeat protein [Tuwongella immobilis]|uniref:Thioredoxin domain-containing protein n=1 Tax=Tuwongella immobilis TaxID=692036 RepID=A0A6C2YJW1_9BACT|nr:tetratricopeptide repeat protein [Tuwongella immobilis]VIP01706.1 thioredoxin : Uncharacterized protein OS=Arenimonas metalli CF5-1 GN=N787_10025 PE=4 SV=1: Thioredoxin: TPR_20 [Tuwongella immobilis]VTR99206.1 thioredoxin : Uncharacterized protein OS=Arenimonas metalli CF5-1 GN=N787_10025 PE=4 SV=1: Thioredoxin: TPR_20 [Tuwongella immobilis]
MSESPWIIDVTEQNFQQEVLVRSQTMPVVVDFWAEWCQPCRILAPVLHAQAEKRNGAFLLAKVNIDECQRIAQYFRIESIPTVLVFRNAEIINGFQGMLPESEIETFLNEFAPAGEPAAPAEPQPILDPAEQEQLLREKIAADREDFQARVDLAGLLVEQGRDAEIEELLASVPPGGELGADADRCRAIVAVRQLAQELAASAPQAPGEAEYLAGVALAAKGDTTAALEQLILAAEEDRTLARTKVREAMLLIFKIIGVRSEEADAFRDRLQRLLY